MPRGETGELWLGGIGVARGYRGNAALTAGRFVLRDGVRHYRTGDVAVQAADGILHFFGRNDDQMKVNGIRVEPSEIETVIERDPRVARAAATWFEQRATGTRALVAAIMLKPGATGTAQDVRAGLAAALPAQLIPARILIMPSLPMTTSGKVDRKAIRNAASEVAPPKPAAQRAMTETERLLAGVWQRFLDLPAVSPEDSFFTIGGDSLGAAQMLVEVELQFGVKLPVTLAFEAPRLAELARHIDIAKARSHLGLPQGRPSTSATGDFFFPIRTTGSGQPLFFFGASPTLVRDGQWTLPCPGYGISFWTSGRGYAKAASFAELVANNVAALREIAPRGPYRLAGFSLGGLMALGVARQLQSDGDVVELLFLLDPLTPPGISSQRAGAPRRSRLQRLAGVLSDPRFIERISRAPGIDLAQYLLIDYFGRNPKSLTRHLLPPDRWPAFEYFVRKITAGYRVAPYRGRSLALFNAAADHERIWGPLLPPGTERIIVEAEHTALFDEPARHFWMPRLAALLDARG